MSAAVRALDVDQAVGRSAQWAARVDAGASGDRRHDRRHHQHRHRLPVAAGAVGDAQARPSIATEAAWLYRNGWPLYALVDRYAPTPRSTQETNCLATAVYFEARGESLEGQLAVAHVVMNRAASGKYPPSWCATIKQPAQFSFVRTRPIPVVDTNSRRVAQGGGDRPRSPRPTSFRASRPTSFGTMPIMSLRRGGQRLTWSRRSASTSSIALKPSVLDGKASGSAPGAFFVSARSARRGFAWALTAFTGDSHGATFRASIK